MAITAKVSGASLGKKLESKLSVSHQAGLKKAQNTRRFTIDLGESFDKLLTELAESQGTTKSEIIRRAVATYAYLTQQTAVENRKVSITDPEDRVIKDIVLP